LESANFRNNNEKSRRCSYRVIAGFNSLFFIDFPAARPD
jgi:hypothetical protein